MAQLQERQTVEFELSSSTPDDRKWVKAYTDLSMEDLAYFRRQQPENEAQAVYYLLERLLLDWSWYAGEEEAPITAENIAKLHPKDLTEMTDRLDLDLSWLQSSPLDRAKKKRSSTTSASNRTSETGKR